MDQIPVFFILSLPLVGAFAMFAVGIVVIHQASRVLSLAHGAMAMVPAYVVFELSELGVPVLFAFPIGVALGGVLGVAIERFFVRPLSAGGGTSQTVGTVAALGLILALSVKIWGTTPRGAIGIVPDGGIDVGASTLRWGHMALMAAAVVSVAGFFYLFRRTDLGLWMRGTADNRTAASLMGVDADRMTRLAWVFGGGLAAIAGILLASVTVLHPINLTLSVLPAFVAALIGGLTSLPGALAGAAIVGITQGMVPTLGLIPGLSGIATAVGAPQLVLTILAFVVMIMRGQRYAVGGADGSRIGSSGTMTPRARRALPRGWPIVLAVLAIFPFIAPFSFLGNAIKACLILLVALSLVLLTGWVGQISLAQATFVGIGAFTTALLARSSGITFPLSLILSAAIAAIAATLLGLVALRVRGLYLAVATLIFLWMSTEYLFRSAWLVGAGGSASLDPQRIGTPDSIPFFDLSERRTFYFVALAAAAAALWSLVNLRDSKTGRAFSAVRGSEVAAASLGIDVTRSKLLAFAASGLLAGVAGNLLIVGAGAASPVQFGFNASLFYLAVTVVGGLGSLPGAVAASLLFAALEEVFFRVSALAGWLDVVSAGLLAVVLLGYPGGLTDIPRAIRARLRRSTTDTDDDIGDVSLSPPRLDATAEEAPAPATARSQAPLEVENVTVRFGGLVAVDDVSLRVDQGEIVGLIGPNGAGKTTMFNAISGLVIPTEGAVTMFGRDVTELPVHERARWGVARTFQVIQLFPTLSVFDNLLVATHTRNPTNAASHVVVTRNALAEEEVARLRVAKVIDVLGLRAIADRQVAGLPFGVLRMVEVARALVTGAPFVMLDEPASGLDSTETDRLSDLIRWIRDRLGVSILLIEHDVAMVTALSDRLYVLDRGALISSGRSADLRSDQRVIDAYLGTTPTDDATDGAPAAEHAPAGG